MIEKIPVFVRAEGEEFRQWTIQRLCEVGTISSTFRKRLDEHKFRALYPHMPECLVQANLSDMLRSQDTLVIIVEGESMIVLAARAIGLDDNPEDCERESLRYCFQRRVPQPPPQVLGDGRTVYYKNFLSYAVNAAQVQNQLKVIYAQ